MSAHPILARLAGFWGLPSILGMENVRGEIVLNFGINEMLAGVAGATPSIGASELLSGAAGAFSIFLLSLVRDLVLRRRERLALMTLVHLEVMHNKKNIDAMLEAPSGISHRILGGLHMDAWEESRTRIAQLEDSQAVDHLGMYYTMLKDLVGKARLRQEEQQKVAFSNEVLEKNLRTLSHPPGTMAKYVCERQTGWVRGWDEKSGLLVVGGSWRKLSRDKEVERQWGKMPSGRK